MDFGRVPGLAATIDLVDTSRGMKWSVKATMASRMTGNHCAFGQTFTENLEFRTPGKPELTAPGKRGIEMATYRPGTNPLAAPTETFSLVIMIEPRPGPGFPSVLGYESSRSGGDLSDLVEMWKQIDGALEQEEPQ
jgi:hypothetical protein